MASRHEIVSIDFRANAGKANPAIDSIRATAAKTNEEITRLKDNLAKGGTAEQIADWTKQLTVQEKKLKALQNAEHNLIKGVGTLNQAIEAFNNGTLDKMSAKFQKTAKNALELQKTQLNPNSETYKKDLAELDALGTRLSQNMTRMKQDFDGLVQTIEAGGRVSVSELSSAKQSLKELSDLTAYGSKEWKAYDAQLTTVSEKLREMAIEQQRATGKDTLGRAFRGDFAGADAQTLEQTITKLKEYQSVIDDPRGKGARHFAAAETQIKQLQSTLDQLKGKYTSADEVIQRFNQHLGETKMEHVNTQAQTLAQTLDEKLSQATSVWDEDIQRETENLNKYEQELKEAQERLASLQAEYDKVQQRYQNRSALGKATLGRRDKKRMAELDFEINGDDEFMGAKDWVGDHQESVRWTKEQLQWYKERKAEALGLTEAVEQLNQAELQGEEKKQEARRMTREQMQQGIKVLEDEAFTIDRTTAEGKARYEQLRQTIDQMNEEIKVAANEMMSLAEAEELADKAMEEQALTTKTGWAASTEELKRAEQTLAEKVAKAKRGTAEEEAAYQKLVRQLQAVRTELGAGSMSGKQMMDVLSNPKNVTSVDTLKAAIGRARQELDALGRRLDQARQSGQNGEVKKLQKTYDELAKSVQQTDIRMKELQNSSKGTVSAFDKAWSRLKTYVGLYVGAAVAMQKLTAAMGDLLTLSDKMGEVRKTTGFTADEVGRLSNNLAKLDTRTTLTQLMELSSLAGSVGLKTQEQVQGFTEAADQLIVALPELGNESARTIIKIANATGDLEKNGGNVRETLEKVGSTIIALRANSASAAGPITDFVSRVGAVGAQAGISIDQIAALGSTIDALGGRVEMSATALSRMIPAIKNNSFAIANSINVTEKYLKSLAPMEQMVLIFQKMRDNIQHIDTSTEEGMNAMADNVEAMLGKNATMREVMKDLEQQGARAGIVFGLLSQNVDELQKQLGIASEAYRENTALANEFNNMNETTAAKWERLKNQVEEMFVGDSAQRFLGGIIDMLRWIVDLLTGDGGISVAIRKAVLVFAVFKAGLGEMVADGIKNIGKLGSSFKNLGKTIWSLNGLYNALASVAIMAIMKVIEVATSIRDTSKAVGELEGQVRQATKAVDNMFYTANKTSNALSKAKEEMELVAKAGGDTSEAEKKMAKAAADHAASIREINNKYGSYLGYMLSETSSAEQLARARELINAKLRETITLKQREAALGNIETEYGGQANKSLGKLDDTIQSWFKDPQQAAAIYTKIVAAVQKFGTDAEGLRREIDTKILPKGGLGRRRSGTTWSILDVAEEYRQDVEKMQKAEKQVNTRFAAQEQQNQKQTRDATIRTLNQSLKDWRDLLTQFQTATGDEKEKLAVEVYKQQRAYTALFSNSAEYFDGDKRKGSIERTIANMRTYEKGLRAVAGEAIKAIDWAERAQQDTSGANVTAGSSADTSAPYGTYNRITSPYIDWDADALVTRRKEMLERVRALANGADVQAVLSEDAKFISEATRKNIKDTKQAIEWYNTERLKIQDALHEKHLTNTGDWMDPKKGGKKASKLVQDEIKYYLDELDAYYTERKAKIQEAQNNEEISEAEARNRTLANEAEWQQRRGELQRLYSKKRKEVAQEEADAIYAIIGERTGDTTDYIQKDIANTIKFIEKVGTEKGKPAMDKIYGDIDLGMAKSFLRQRNAIGQHMKDITAIVNKENPYAGITEELRKNLGTMNALLTDIEKEEERTVDKEIERTMFILEQSTKGYALTWEELMREMAKRGWQAWADAVNGDTQTQERLMHQVYRVFEKVQDAIKKEASEMKKQADIMWSNILLPGGDGKTTIKDAFEQTIGALGIEEGRVSRANSLIGAGQASERVADRLAIQQMKVQLAMQQYQYSLVRKIGREKIESLRKEAQEAEAIGDIEKARQARMQAQNAEMALNLATRKEQTEELKQQDAIIAKTEESQNRLYTAMKEWADLLSSSLQSVFEATHAGDAEYFNERAKLNLTGKGGPGAGTYIIIDNEGTSDATAHYEYLNEREALERQREIANQNAFADAMKKALDDINMKMSEQITDWINASLQTASLDANTQAVLANTEALYETAGEPAAKPQGTVAAGGNGRAAAYGEGGGEWMPPMEMPEKEPGAEYMGPWTKWAEVSSKATETMVNNNKKVEKSTKASFAAMTAAANMYGIAYQAMSNENLSTTQKFELMALQAVGNYTMSALTAELSAASAKAATDSPGVLGTLWKQLGWAAAPVFAIFTGLLGGLMGVATSKISKAKSEIAQVTGASHASAGRLSTGMLQYAEGNVNEFTDPSTLQTGKQYNVDAADGRTYRARFMGKGAKTHITHGPEFHLVGEAGREAIIDAKTTQNIRMNEPEIWRTIQILSGGGRISAMRRRGRGVAAFADGNVDEMGGVGDMGNVGGMGMSAELTASLQASLDRNSDIMERIATEGIKGIFDVYGKDGLVETYDRGKKTMSRYGKRY